MNIAAFNFGGEDSWEDMDSQANESIIEQINPEFHLRNKWAGTHTQLCDDYNL